MSRESTTIRPQFILTKRKKKITEMSKKKAKLKQEHTVSNADCASIEESDRTDQEAPEQCKSNSSVVHSSGACNNLEHPLQHNLCTAVNMFDLEFDLLRY